MYRYCAIALALVLTGMVAYVATHEVTTVGSPGSGFCVQGYPNGATWDVELGGWEGEVRLWTPSYGD